MSDCLGYQKILSYYSTVLTNFIYEENVLPFAQYDNDYATE